MSAKRLIKSFYIGFMTGAVSMILSGCGSDYYRAETTLNSDGSVERAVYQPHKDTPENTRNPKIWKTITRSGEIEPEDWEGSIRDLPLNRDNKDNVSYFAAWNRFSSIDKIPDHYIRKSPDGSKEARLKRQVRQTDCVFVIEHEWSEVLTDIVSLEDMHKASLEFAEMVIDFGKEVLSETLGENYDIFALENWFRTEGIEWFSEVLDLHYDISARRSTLGENELKRLSQMRLAAICLKHGVEIQKENDRQIWRDFAEQNLLVLVKKKDGQPLEEEFLLMILDDFFPIEEKKDKSAESTLDKAAKRVIVRKYGGQDAFFNKLKIPLARILGVHNFWIDNSAGSREFEYSLAMPGTVVETNGVLISNIKVRWSFKAKEAYPHGYTMKCRSLEPRFELQKKLLGKPTLLSREKMLQFVKIFIDDEELQTALILCELQENLVPLEAYRQRQISDGDVNKIRRIKQLWKILDLQAKE